MAIDGFYSRRRPSAYAFLSYQGYPYNGHTLATGISETVQSGLLAETGVKVFFTSDEL